MIPFLPPAGDRIDRDQVATGEVDGLALPPVRMEGAVRPAVAADHPFSGLFNAQGPSVGGIPLGLGYPLLERRHRFMGLGVALGVRPTLLHLGQAMTGRLVTDLGAVADGPDVLGVLMPLQIGTGAAAAQGD
jgi:hypothetical protein